jgi:hypothetical protein
MFAHGLPAEKDELRVRSALPLSIHSKISEDVEGVFAWFDTALSGASCKMIFSPNLFVMLKILSSEYQLYACGKIFRMPRFWTKIFSLQEALRFENCNIPHKGQIPPLPFLKGGLCASSSLKKRKSRILPILLLQPDDLGNP